MTRKELSWKEKNDLYKLSLLPTFIVFFAILIYFNYLMYTNPLKTLWDYLINIGLLYILMPISFLITFEVLHHRKTGEPFHLERLATRILLVLLSTFSLIAFLFAAQQNLSPLIGYWEGILLGCFLWVLLVTLLALKFRKTLMNVGIE